MLTGLADWLFDPSGLTPHGFCLLWEPGLIWTHALSDAAIGLAYFTIPFSLTVLAKRRRDLAFRPVFWLFAAFILLCGTGHWIDLATLWLPAYGAQAVVKVATALASVVTAIAVWRLLPEALALPSPARLREAHAALRASEARYRASFQRSPVPLHMLDGSGVITGVSDSWLALLGYLKHEVIGRHIADFMLPDAPAWPADDLTKLLAEGEIRDVERGYKRHDGGVVEALVSARLERGADGLLADGPLIVCVIIDITARRRAEAALRASEAALRQAQKMEAVGQLTGGIAHDFNNILQSIAGGLDLMERRIAQGRAAEAGRFVAVARQAVDRAAGLTHRMLAFARRQTLEPRPVNPDELVRGMTELIARTVGPSVSVVLRLDDGRWPALCDANQLESALLNLAINARDAMPEGGTLTIATADRTLSAGDLSGQDDAPPGDYVEITVADTGTGMTPDVLARAFEPFFTTKPLGLGTGLGLSQLYGFMRQSGGVVRLESAVGHGTTARLYLPRHGTREENVRTTEEAAAAPDFSAGPDAVLSGRTIVVVDDEAPVLAQISETLRDMGCAVLDAQDGPSGLRRLRSRERVDLLVTDIGLPGMNGRQLAEAAREIDARLPILLITGYAGTALEDMGLAPGMEVMRKPFTLDDLATRARAMLDPSAVAAQPGD